MPSLETAGDIILSPEIKIKNSFTPDIAMIRQIYDSLDKTERTIDLKEYLVKQVDEALGEENRRKAAEAYGLDISRIAPDEAMLFYAQSGESERFALENMRYRADQDLGYIKNYYKKYLSEKK
jgi:hypothetical protein